MSITLDLVEDELRILVLKGPKFAFDKDRVKRTPSARAIFDEVTKKFLYWQLNRGEICSLLERFDESEIIPTKAAQEVIDTYKTASTPASELPAIEGDLDFALVPHLAQEEYIRMHESKRCMLLSFDQGLGKSYASLERAEVLGFTKMIIVMPQLLLENWETELQQAYGEGCVIYYGSKAERAHMREGAVDKARIVVTTPFYLPELSEYRFDHIILDEAHTYSRPATDGFKKVDALLYQQNPTAARQVLSGTPAQLDVVDLWGTVYFTCREIAGTRWAWQKQYEEVLQSIQKTYKGRVITIPIKTRTCNLDHMQKRIAPIFVRVRREGITKFKETPRIVKIKMTPRQKELYDQIRLGIIVELEKDKVLKANQVLTQILGLRQVGEGLFNLCPEWDDSSKLEYILARLEERAGKGKTVIYSAFKEIGNRIHAHYPNRCVLYNGDVSKTRKKLAVVSFQGAKNESELQKFLKWRKRTPDWLFGPGEADIICLTLDPKQGLGVNLDAADYGIFPSWHWNHFVNVQGRDRMHRLTQKSAEVITEFLVAEESIEGFLFAKILDRYARVSDTLDGRETISTSEAREFVDALKRG